MRSGAVLSGPTAQRVTAAAAGILLSGWLVAEAQAFLTYNRLMVMAEAREATPLSRVLLVLGLVLCVVHAAQRVMVPVRASGARRRTGVTLHRLLTAAAACGVGYVVGLAQW